MEIYGQIFILNAHPLELSSKRKCNKMKRNDNNNKKHTNEATMRSQFYKRAQFTSSELRRHRQNQHVGIVLPEREHVYWRRTASVCVDTKMYGLCVWVRSQMTVFDTVVAQMYAFAMNLNHTNWNYGRKKNWNETKWKRRGTRERQTQWNERKNTIYDTVESTTI